MIVNFFKSNNPIVSVMIPILASLFWVTSYLFGNYNKYVYTNDFGFLIYNKLDLFFQKNEILEIILGIAIVSFQSIFLNIIFNRNEFYEKNIFLPSMIYVILISCVPGMQFVSPVLIANTFIIFALYYIYKIKRQEDAKNNIFMTSLMLGIAASLNPPFLIFLLIPIAALIIIRPFQVKEYILTFIGFTIPWGYFFVFKLLFGSSITLELSKQLTINESINFNYFENNTTLKIIMIVVFSILLLQGIVKWRSSLLNSGLRFKRLNQLNIVFFLIGLVLCGIEILLTNINFNVISMVIPLTLILPFGLTYGKNTSTASFLWHLLIILSLANIIFF